MLELGGRKRLHRSDERVPNRGVRDDDGFSIRSRVPRIGKVFAILCVATVCHGLAAGQTPEPPWPSEPIAVSPVEGVIESFWDRRLGAIKRWRASDGALSRTWDSTWFEPKVGKTSSGGEITRPYEIDLQGYRRLRVRLRPGAGVRTIVRAEVDGVTRTVVEKRAENNDALEIVGPLHGKRLTRVTLRFEADDPVPRRIQLRWILLERDGAAWKAPVDPFAEMVVSDDVGRCEPGLGLLFGIEELRRMRQVVESEPFRAVWQADRRYAARQFTVDPATLIRPYSFYIPTRYGRDADDRYETVDDGVMLALVGMITGNEAYLRQAARHAIVLAHIDHWAEGFVDRLPGHPWYHSGFAPNVATIKASLLLDWTWHHLTPKGRSFIREAIARKGLPYLDRAKDAMANQGVRFAKGLILGRMAVAESLEDPQIRAHVRASIERMNRKLDAIIGSDGTFSEGMGYGKGTMASTPISYVAAARCLGVPTRDLVTPRMLPAMRFLLEAERELDPVMASFCAGPLGDATFAAQCAPVGLIHDYTGFDYPTTRYEGNRPEYVYFGLPLAWAPSFQAKPQPVRLPKFSVYPRGGWVFAGSEDPREPRLGFESGLWDGQGHAWHHKHALTLDGWGERLLVTRHILPYSDARSEHTMKTTLYNTFAPSGRDQDASGAKGRGAKLIGAEDLGPVCVIESDNASAWRRGVKRAVRRVLFFRPRVLVVCDDVELESAESGVQSWNGFSPWLRTGPKTYEAGAGAAKVRLTAVAPESVETTVGPASVSREHTDSGWGESPVFRAAFTTPEASTHHLVTMIEALAPDEQPRQVVRVRKAAGVVEIRDGETIATILLRDSDVATLLDCSTDGRLLFVVHRGGVLVTAGAFDATWIQTPEKRLTGAGFLHWSARE